MTDEQIREVVLTILRRIAPESDPAALGPDDNIRRTLDIDSFDALNFFIRLDEELGVSVPEADYGRLHTLAEIVRYLAARVQ
ncbi:acyl carrier protein [Desulfoprunum benzoelyticum]|uniref:Acyl carrier protein n=1 Tax=Desulfoprunum benzoelyticum TaxID=1506996 RepID=A0A840UR86_9BACT|nr:acyl carrier protein [Desulfoprunum benzoelyticum]MBB5347163.1 acyl carrier protein [Desulfoprunum benzoelyticum]MBM9531369.1 acyl carrier protein [Desulfoprunum benzoelyticum]